VAVNILALDVGSSSVRAVVFGEEGTQLDARSASLRVHAPDPGTVEYDADELASTVIELAASLSAEHQIGAVGIANQRGSTVLWDPIDGRAVGPVIGWQDQRTAARCAELTAAGIIAFPNQTPAKAAWLWDQVDPDRKRELRVGTIDSWLTWCLSDGAAHVSDITNMATAGLLNFEGSELAVEALEALLLPPQSIPTPVATSGAIAPASVLNGAPMITALVGDQQASLAGHGCRNGGDAKLTVGSGLSLNVLIDAGDEVLGQSGCFPIVAWQREGQFTRGFEAIDLSGGSTIEWLCDLGIYSSPEMLVAAAAAVTDSGGVVMVPSLSGFGTPSWDVAATGAIYGLTRGSDAAQIAHALLRGLTFRAAELLDAAVDELGRDLDGPLRLDGGLTRSEVFAQWLADACGHQVAVAEDPEVTARGAATLAAAGADSHSENELTSVYAVTHRIIEPRAAVDRGSWDEAVARTHSV
jgi:glycerol kinase